MVSERWSERLLKLFRRCKLTMVLTYEGNCCFSCYTVRREKKWGRFCVTLAFMLSYWDVRTSALAGTVIAQLRESLTNREVES